MALIQLSDYHLSPVGAEKGINKCSFTLKRGDVWAIKTDSENDAHLFIRGLATLSYPYRGKYRYDGNRLDFTDYRNLLSVKKKIGYLANDSALISNRTVRDNLSVTKAYFENDLSYELEEETIGMCRELDIEKLIDYRPVNIGAMEKRKVMLVRELVKQPEVMLIEYPEEFAGAEGVELVKKKLTERIDAGMALVYLSYDPEFSTMFSGKTLSIYGGAVDPTGR